jgi:hypothetical protein
VTEAAGAADAGVAPAREQGWWRPVLALVALVFLPATPLFRLAVPLEQTFLLLAPLIAACALAGWRAGGRLPLAAFWTAIAVVVLWQGSRGAGSFDLLAGGWAVILAVAFGGALLSPFGSGFLPQALLALGAAVVLGGVLVMAAPDGAGGAAEVLATELSRRADLSTAQWRQMTGTVEWQDFIRSNPDAGRFAEEVDRQLAAMPAFGRRLVLSLLALESLAAMALAWAFYHRVGRVRLGPPLARLRDLRFDDALVWGVVAGLVIVVLPFTGIVRALGINLLVFFGVLYALRGLGVMVWFLAPGRVMTVILIVFTLLFWYVVGAVAAAVGLGDTWLDWRRTSRQRSQRTE